MNINLGDMSTVGAECFSTVFQSDAVCRITTVFTERIIVSQNIHGITCRLFQFALMGV